MRGTRIRLPFIMLGLCVFILAGTVMSCDKGCLRCGTDGKCSACDTKDQYYRKDDGTCVKAEIENCLVTGFAKSECLQCEAEMVYDSVTAKCVGVVSSKKEPNCEMYNPSGECVACETEYYLSAGECFPATLEVEHCLVFSKANFCLVCEGNRRFDEDSGRCVDFTPVPNCGIHTHAVCDECLHDYAKVPGSYYFTPQFDRFTEQHLNKISFYMNDVSFLSTYRQTAPVRCTEMSSRCLKHAFDSTTRFPIGCEVCDSNYLLNPDTLECDDMPTPIIQSCRFYTDSLTCKECVEMTYLDGNECKSITEVQNCMKYKAAANECKECEASHFLSAATTCTQRTRESIDNCEVLSVTLDECHKCFEDYKMTDDKKACLLPIKNCANDGYAASTFSTTEFICETCITDYYPGEGKKTCEKQSSPHCVTFDDGTNSCKTCTNFNFYLEGTSPNVKCKLKTQKNCSKFSEDYENKCITCNQLYSLDNATGACVALEDANCVRNTENTTDCLACKPGFILDGSNPCKESKRGYDPLCVESGSVDGKCEKCVDGYTPYKVSSTLKKLPDNCISIDPSSDYCIACAEDMDGVPLDAGPPEIGPKCVPRAGDEGKCLQLNTNVFEPLLDNDGKCKKCRNYDTHYFSSLTCNLRTEYKKLQCKELHETVDFCKSCNEGFVLEKMGNDSEVCMPKPENMTDIPNCDIYDYFNDGKCLKCKVGFDWTIGTPDTCTSSGAAELPDFNKYHLQLDSNLKIVEGRRGDPAIDNCEESIWVYNGGAAKEVCIKCLSGHNEIVESGLTAYKYDDYDQKSNIWTMSSKYMIKECKTITKDDFVKYAVDSDNTQLAANCQQVKDISANNYMCVKCKDNFVGVVKGLAFDKDGTGMPSQRGYAECNPALDYGLQSTKTNQGFRLMTDANQIFFKQPGFLYDHCQDEKKSPVFFGIKEADHFTMEQEGIDGQEKPQWNCMEIPELKKQGACVSYFLKNDQVTESRDYANADYKCFKCAPGYRLKYETREDEIFGQCEAIENCELNPTTGEKNSWLDACSSCRAGYAWDYLNQSNYKIPNIQKCVDARRFPGCLVMDSGANKCLMCKSGKTLNPNTEQCEDYPPSCETPGFPKMETSKFSGHQASYEFNQAFLRKYFGEYLKTGKDLCGSCKAGSHWFMAKDLDEGKRFVCRNVDFSENLVQGCKIYNGQIENKCFECEKNYVLNFANSTCLRKSANINYKNCKLAFPDAGPFVCKECMNNMASNSSGICVPNEHCVKKNLTYGTGDLCITCEPGFKKDPNNQWKCIEITVEDECIEYDHNGTCIACKDPKKIPIYYLTTGNFTKCIENPSERKEMLEKYSFFYKNSFEVKLIADLKAGISLEGMGITRNWEGNPDLFEYICVRDNEDCGCETFSDQVTCSKCKDTHYMNNSTRKCELGRMKGCLKFNGKNDCDACDFSGKMNDKGMTYYLKNDVCHLHTVVNCVGKSDKADECDICQKGYYLENKMCHPNKISTNCIEFVENKDECTKCDKGYYLDSKECHQQTVNNCKKYNLLSNSCDECADDYYRFNTATNINFNCALNTSINCKTKSKTSNKCSECLEGEYYFEDSVGCLPIIPTDNCQESDKLTGHCKVCVEGFWLNSNVNKCIANPSGVKDCVMYSDKSTCSKCAATHFLQDNACVLLTETVVNCMIHNAQGVCEQCNNKHIKSEDGKTCAPVTELTCNTWVDVENCETCVGNNVLKTNDSGKAICVSSGLSHCKTAKLESEVISCALCNTGFILKEGKCHAPKISILNCEQYDPETEQCSECFSGFLLSVDKDECVNRIGEAGLYCAKGHLVKSSEPVCTMCGFGHYEDQEGACVACGGDGCLICDLKDTTKCSLCQSKWYMKSDKTCSENDPKSPTSARIVEMISLIGLMFLFFRD